MKINAENYKPMNNRLLVLKLNTPEKTQGGIFVPETAQIPLQLGVVISLPESYEGELFAGAIVGFGKYAGTEVTDHVYLDKAYCEVIGSMLEATGEVNTNFIAYFHPDKCELVTMLFTDIFFIHETNYGRQLKEAYRLLIESCNSVGSF